MQTENRFLDDLARVMGGALGTAAGLMREIDDLVRLRLERLLAEMNLVTREEFEAVQEMAAKARTEQERLAERVAALEREIAAPGKPRRAKAKRAEGRTKAGVGPGEAPPSEP